MNEMQNMSKHAHYLRVTSLSVLIASTGVATAHTANECIVSENQVGDLVCTRRNEQVVLANGFAADVSQSMEQTSVMGRDDGQFLVNQSYAADHNTIVVPIRQDTGLPYFERIIEFARDRFTASEQPDYPIYGNEYALATRHSLKDFSWDNVRNLIDTQVTLAHKKAGQPRGGGEAIMNRPKGFTLTETRVYGADGGQKSTRYYIDPVRWGFSVDTTGCFINCPTSAKNEQSRYGGGVGKSYITGDMHITGSQFTGRYKYAAGSHSLEISGTVSENNEVELVESDPKSASKVTGRIQGKVRNRGIEGTWTSPDGKRTAPFFFMPRIL
jgi:hypothetical protein